MVRYNLILTNDVFKDEKTGREINFSRLSVDIGYKKLKLTSDASDICAILDITERKLKTEFPYDGTEHRVGCLVFGEQK